MVVAVAVDPIRPLFFANQHTYFLHGWADAGIGGLAHDAVARSADPTPVFSWLVTAVTDTRQLWVFQLIHLATVAALAVSLVAIASTLVPMSQRAALGTAAVIGLAQSALPTSLTPWKGVANQSLLDGYLQPSSFGVLLVAAVAVFLRSRSPWAMLVAAPAAWLHPTYAVSVAVFGTAAAGYLWRVCRDRKGALIAGAVLVSTMAPVLFYVRATFIGSPTDMAASNMLLAVVRIPHHALPGQWCGKVTVVTLMLVAASLWIIRDKAFRTIIGSAATVGIVGAVAQVVTGSAQLALLFPWRVSVWVAPVAAVALLASAAAYVGRARSGAQHQEVTILLAVAAIALTVIGAAVKTSKWRAPPPAYEAAVRFIQTATPTDEVVLVDPMLGEDVRTLTQRALYADWKTHPYLAADVRAWYARVQAAQRVMEIRSSSPCTSDREAAALGATLVLTPASSPACSTTPVLYGDAQFRVYAVAS